MFKRVFYMSFFALGFVLSCLLAIPMAFAAHIVVTYRRKRGLDR